MVIKLYATILEYFTAAASLRVFWLLTSVVLPLRISDQHNVLAEILARCPSSHNQAHMHRLGTGIGIIHHRPSTWEIACDVPLSYHMAEVVMVPS